MALVFAVMHLHNILKIFSCFSPFLFFLSFFLSGIEKSMERSKIPTCPSLMSVFVLFVCLFLNVERRMWKGGMGEWSEGPVSGRGKVRWGEGD